VKRKVSWRLAKARIGAAAPKEKRNATNTTIFYSGTKINIF
jgi:hypothetical protein